MSQWYWQYQRSASDWDLHRSKCLLEFCTFTMYLRQTRNRLDMQNSFWFDSPDDRLHHDEFLKNWTDYKDIVLYLFSIQKVSIRGKWRDIFKRMNNCFESLFFRQLFQEAYSLRKYCFIVIHISRSFDKLKQSYKRSYLQNKRQGVFILLLC